MGESPIPPTSFLASPLGAPLDSPGAAGWLPYTKGSSKTIAFCLAAGGGPALRNWQIRPRLTGTPHNYEPPEKSFCTFSLMALASRRCLSASCPVTRAVPLRSGWRRCLVVPRFMVGTGLEVLAAPRGERRAFRPERRREPAEKASWHGDVATSTFVLGDSSLRGAAEDARRELIAHSFAREPSGA